MSNENNHENMDNQQPENPTVIRVVSSVSIPESERLQAEKCETSSEDKVNKVKPMTEENTGIAIKNVENESLNNLLAYDSDSSSSSEMMKLDLKWLVRDETGEMSSDSSLSSDEDDDEEEESEESSDEEQELKKATTKDGAIKKQNLKKNKMDGDLSIEDLPPVPDLSTLNINVEHEQFVHMGNVLGIVDKLVTVAAIPNSPAYDLDTLLFLDDGKRPLGFVFDVLGQVTSPIYAVRFNSADDIKNLQLEVGTKIYSAPLSKHTQYVFVQQLLKMKGTDASWVGDNEVPPEFADYSDDECESQFRFGTVKPGPHLKRTHSSDTHKKFESTMNRKNLLNTKFIKYIDSCKQARFNRTTKVKQEAQQVPRYDPTVPPPSFGYVSYGGGGGENNNALQRQGYVSHLFTNNFVANLSHTNSANYFTNHAAGHNHPGPSHE